MKHYILKCRVSSAKLPGGGIGHVSDAKIYSESELEPISKNLSYLVASGKASKHKDEKCADIALEKFNAIDAEIVTPADIARAAEEAEVEKQRIADEEAEAEKQRIADEKSNGENKENIESNSKKPAKNKKNNKQ